MAIVSRPGKSDPGGSSDYKSGAVILADEVNADISTLYGLVNGNINNANIIDGAGITYSRLALGGNVKNADVSATADIVGTKLAIGTLPGNRLEDGAIPTAKLADDSVTVAKISGGTTKLLDQVPTIRDYYLTDHPIAGICTIPADSTWHKAHDLTTDAWRLTGIDVPGRAAGAGAIVQFFLKLNVGSTGTGEDVWGQLRLESATVGTDYHLNMFVLRRSDDTPTKEYQGCETGIVNNVVPADDYELSLYLWNRTGGGLSLVQPRSTAGPPPDSDTDAVIGGTGKAINNYMWVWVMGVG